VEPKKAKWPKILPRFENRQDAIVVCKELCKLQFILRCEKRGKGELGVSSNSSFCDVLVKDLLLTFCLDDANA
jgi:translocation protein SEC62